MESEVSGQLLDGVVAVVAGASSGIGAAVARRFAEHGATVEMVAIHEAELHAAEAELLARGHRVHASALDASDESAVAAFAAGLSARHDRVGALVNSIGIQRYGTVETTSVATWDEVMAVNVRAMFLMAKHVVPLMRANGSGSIVNISSAQAIASQRNVVAYTASKGAIVAMTRAMAVDLAPDRIRVNCLCPGSVDTPMLRAAARDVSPDDPDAVIAEWGAGHPIGRVGRAAEIADVALFLASGLSTFVTGADIRTDGGVLAGVALQAPQHSSDTR